MKLGIIKLSVLTISMLLLAFQPAEKKPMKIYLVGDSTMSVKDTRKYPETGWGMPFAHFFDDKVTVENHAKNGRSTKSFMEEGLWQPVVNKLQEGDWVFIQFGHNDESPKKVGRYTTPQEYKANLSRYIEESRNKGAKPVLLTPVARRSFDANGKIQGTHDEYSELARAVAREQQVPLIDMDKKSQQLLQEFGPEQSKLLFLQLEPGEHPNYPNGVEDNTHFSELGARLIAQMVLADVKAQSLGLAERIYKPEVKQP
ncbi:rhamnogalacturonan acetylesterase [Cesiribacter sp. SM1]|uniref:rhamnogalacturonan acetylesterase n=1 Tax=Cesiribacter sp. SM1 TaxID=2861196 RepID=UPI001CD77827|nr:rhamnogalacturonan acetylesterase [Cesiribacter sp. SM1]